MNKVMCSIENWNPFHFTTISFTIQFQKQEEKINLSWGSDVFLE